MLLVGLGLFSCGGSQVLVLRVCVGVKGIFVCISVSGNAGKSQVILSLNTHTPSFWLPRGSFCRDFLSQQSLVLQPCTDVCVFFRMI